MWFLKSMGKDSLEAATNPQTLILPQIATWFSFP